MWTIKIKKKSNNITTKIINKEWSDENYKEEMGGYNTIANIASITLLFTSSYTWDTK
jgi:hypothetical protein